MKRLIVLCLALAGCASVPPAVEVRTVKVPVIRVEHCLTPGDVPKRPGSLPKRPASISAALDVAVAHILAWQSYGEKADAVLKGCAAP